MTKFLHTADIHLGKTYRSATDEAERYEDFFPCLAASLCLERCETTRRKQYQKEKE